MNQNNGFQQIKKRRGDEVIKTIIPSEHEEQEVVVQYATVKNVPLFAIPNGTWLSGDCKIRCMQMNKLKKEGLVNGIPDLMIPVPTRNFAGLFIEMKRTKNYKLSKIQKDKMEKLSILKYKVVLAIGGNEAIKEINNYLKDCENEDYKKVNWYK